MQKEILVAISPHNVWYDRLKEIQMDSLMFELTHTSDDFFNQYYERPYDAFALTDKHFDASVREMIQKIRRLYDIPIIILAEEKDDINLSVSLGLGADEYLCFDDSDTVLSARLQALLRRNEVVSNKNQWLTINDTKINLVTREVIRDNQRTTLPKKIYELLKLFVENPQRIITKEDIYMTVWHERSFFSEANINVYIRRLRQAIEKDPAHPQLIVTVWGQGYRFSGSIKEGF